MDIIPPQELPHWLTYPPEYSRVVADGLVKFAPWYLLNAKLARLRYEGLQKRYPNRRLFAFAARSDNDDIACWEEGPSGRVVVLHDFASQPYESRSAHDSFWAWFRAAIEDYIQHET